MKIAMLEEHADNAELMVGWLHAAGFGSMVLHDSRKAFSRDVPRGNYDLLIVGAQVAEGDGSEALIWVREHLSATIPVLRIAENNSEEDVVAALKAGADDCMVMPLRRAEFLARVEALGRRAPRGSGMREVLNLGDLSVDLKNRVISRDGQRLSLTPKSYDLAVFLFSNLGQLMSRDYLMQQIWRRGSGASTRTLDTHISRLRSDLNLTPENGWLLQSVYQHGYRLEQIEASRGLMTAPAHCEQFAG